MSEFGWIWNEKYVELQTEMLAFHSKDVKSFYAKIARLLTL